LLVAHHEFHVLKFNHMNRTHVKIFVMFLKQ
jgi:hypothetical protein